MAGEEREGAGRMEGGRAEGRVARMGEACAWMGEDRRERIQKMRQAGETIGLEGCRGRMIMREGSRIIIIDEGEGRGK